MCSTIPLYIREYHIVANARGVLEHDARALGHRCVTPRRERLLERARMGGCVDEFVDVWVDG